MASYKVWADSPSYAYSLTTPFIAGDVGKFLYVTGGTGWTSGYYKILSFVAVYNVGADGDVALARLSGFPTGAATSEVGTGTIVGARPQTPNYLVLDGNSFFASNTDYGEWSRRLTTAIPNTWQLSAFGVAGQQTTQMTSDAVSQIVPELLTSGYARVMLLVFEGVNALFAGKTGAVAYGEIKTYCETVKAAAPNTQIALCTGTPRNEGGQPADYATQLAAYNALLRTDFSRATNQEYIYAKSSGVAYADLLFDINVMSEFNVLSGTWFIDNIHPTNAGGALLATRSALLLSAFAGRRFPLPSPRGRRR